MEIKHNTTEIENIQEQGSNDFTEEQQPVDTKYERRILKKNPRRKIDLRLIPILAALYTICLIDRTNIGVARISGIDAALDLDVGSRASISLLVFYVGYVIFELPSNMVLRKIGPANWLSFLGLAFGLVELGMGFSKNWGAFSVLRVFLGIFEAGIFPGSIYLISSWYRRYEVQKRIAVFFLTASLLSSFANILAYGLIQIADNPVTDGWKWIFIIEGVITCSIGILTRFILIDFPGPRRNRFLSNSEKQYVSDRLIDESGATAEQKITWRVIRETCGDWRVWAIAYMYQTGSTGTYGFLLFLPIILNSSLGYSQELSFLLSAPPAIFAVVFAYTLSWVADKTHRRGPYMVFASILSLIGLAMIGFLDAPVPRYIGAFLGDAGMYSLIVTGLAWGQNNVKGDAKRSVASAIQIMMAGVGGIYSATVFRQQDAPRYVPGIVALGAMILLTLIMAPITSYLLWRANKLADNGLKVIDGDEGYRYTW